MIIGKENASQLSNLQILRLMELVSDNKPITLTIYPYSPASCTLIREGIKYEIHPDGSFDSTEQM